MAGERAETMIQRLVLAATLVGAAAATPALAGQSARVSNDSLILTVLGDDGPEDISVVQTAGGSSYTITDSTGILAGTGCEQVDRNTVSCRFPTAVIDVNGFAGDDRITVDIAEPGRVNPPLVARIRGGLGNDVMTGGPQQDVFLQTLGFAGSEVDADTMYGMGGYNVLDYQDSTPRRTDLTVRLPDPGTISVGNGEAGENDTLAGIQAVLSGYGNDRLQGNSEKNSLIGNDGNDYIYNVDGKSWDNTDCARQGAGDADRGDRAVVDNGENVQPECERVIKDSTMPSELDPLGKVMADAVAGATSKVTRAKLLKARYLKLPFAAPIAGRLRGELFLPIAKPSAAARVLAGKVSTTFAAPGSAAVKVRLSARGRKLLRRSPRNVRATLRVTFVPLRGTTEVRSRAFRIR